jgi:hypothetical protein
VQDGELDPWGSREPFGSFWFWVDGRPIGNTHATEQLALAFLPLASRATRRRPDARFGPISNLDKLNMVIGCDSATMRISTASDGEPAISITFERRT